MSRSNRDRIRHAFDHHTRAVRWSDDQRTVVVWSGGVTYNVYTVARDGEITATTSFELSDDEGRAVSRERAVEKMEDHLAQRRD